MPSRSSDLVNQDPPLVPERGSRSSTQTPGALTGPRRIPVSEQAKLEGKLERQLDPARIRAAPNDVGGAGSRIRAGLRAGVDEDRVIDGVEQIGAESH